MRIKAEIFLKGLKKSINRIALINSNMTLEDFCRYVIVSMNGNCKHLFQLILNEEKGYLGPGYYVNYPYDEQMMEDLTLEDLELFEEDKLMINYDF